MTVDTNIRPPINPVQPGAYGTVDASAVAANTSSDIEKVAILGAAGGGAPNSPMLILDPYALRNRLRSGAGYDAARFAFSRGAAPVVFVRVGAGILQSTKLLAGASGTGVTLTSLDYGAWTNNIKVTVAANNVVTITYVDGSGQTFKEIYDVGVSATAVQVANAINGLTAGYPKSNFVSAVAGAGTMPLATLSIAAMASGSDGTVSAGDWTTGLQKLETEDVQIVVVATGDATIHAQVQAHCLNMSAPVTRRERTQLCGAVLAESVAQQITRAGAFAEKRTELIYPGFVDFDDAGSLKTWDPFYAAAAEAGYKVAQKDPTKSRIHAPFAAVDLEVQLSTLQGGDVDQLLRAGVAPITRAPAGGFWLVDELSTYTADNYWRDFPKIRGADLVVKRLREGLEAQFVGAKSLDGSQKDIKQFATSICENLKTEEKIRAFQPQGIAVSQGPDPKTYYVTVPVMLVDSIKWIFLAVALQPSSTVNLAASASLT